MLIQQLASSQAEGVFVVGQNVSNGTLLGNTLAAFESHPLYCSFVSFGNALNSPQTSNLAAFAGVVHENIAANAFGLVQVYGARLSVAAHVGAVSLSAQGLIIGPAAGLVSAQTNGRSFNLGPIVLLDNDLSGAGFYKGFIRAL